MPAGERLLFTLLHGCHGWLGCLGLHVSTLGLDGQLFGGERVLVERSQLCSASSHYCHLVNKVPV